MIFFESGELKDYKARLLDREISIVNSERSNIWADNFLKPVIGSPKFKWKKIKLTIEYSGSVQEIENNKAIIHSKIDNHFIRFKDISGVRYFVLVDGSPSISNNYHDMFQSLTYNLMGYAEKEMETAVNLTGSSSVVMADEMILESPATIEVSGNNSVVVEINDDKFEVSGIGSMSVFIGEGKVTKGNANHWDSVDFKRFPKVKAGENVVKITPSTAKVKLKFRGLLR